MSDIKRFTALTFLQDRLCRGFPELDNNGCEIIPKGYISLPNYPLGDNTHRTVIARNLSIAVCNLHNQGLCHMGITKDKIYINSSGEVLLTGFDSVVFFRWKYLVLKERSNTPHDMYNYGKILAFIIYGKDLPEENPREAICKMITETKEKDTVYDMIIKTCLPERPLDRMNSYALRIMLEITTAESYYDIDYKSVPSYFRPDWKSDDPIGTSLDNWISTLLGIKDSGLAQKIRLIILDLNQSPDVCIQQLLPDPEEI